MDAIACRICPSSDQQCACTSTKLVKHIFFVSFFQRTPAAHPTPSFSCNNNSTESLSPALSPREHFVIFIFLFFSYVFFFYYFKFFFIPWLVRSITSGSTHLLVVPHWILSAPSSPSSSATPSPPQGRGTRLFPSCREFVTGELHGDGAPAQAVAELSCFPVDLK